ncbi:hypothetical protein [Streptomyces bauhiniae]
MTRKPASFRELATWHTEQADDLSREDGAYARNPEERKQTRQQAAAAHRRRAAELHAEADAYGER